MVKTMFKKIIIILLLLTTAACTSDKLNTFGMPKDPKVGPDEYKQGWHDGCKTGMNTYGSSYMRTKYKTTINAQMMQNPYYRRGWDIGQRYCSYYISTYLSNHEFFANDLRSKNTWVKLQSDGLFSYTGWTTFKWNDVFTNNVTSGDDLFNMTYDGFFQSDPDKQFSYNGYVDKQAW